MDEKPTRRWFQFSLRTLFLVTTALCAWIAYQMAWIGERHDAEWLYGGVDLKGQCQAPWSLRIFGERGVSYVRFSIYADDRDTFEERKEERLRHLTRLFPEAEIVWLGYGPVER